MSKHFVRVKEPITFHRHRFNQTRNAQGHNTTHHDLLGPFDITQYPREVTPVQYDALRRSRVAGKYFIFVDADRNPVGEAAAASEPPVPEPASSEPPKQSAPPPPQTEPPAPAPLPPIDEMLDAPEPAPDTVTVGVDDPADSSDATVVASVTTTTEAAEYLTQHGVPVEHLQDTTGRLHHAKINAAAKAMGVEFPNYP